MESSANHILDTFFLSKKETLLKCSSMYPRQATNTIYNTYHSCNPSSLRGNQKWFSPYHAEKVIGVKKLSSGGLKIVEFKKNVS